MINEARGERLGSGRNRRRGVNSAAPAIGPVCCRSGSASRRSARAKFEAMSDQISAHNQASDSWMPRLLVGGDRHDRRGSSDPGIGNREQQHDDAECVFGLHVCVGDPEPSAVVLRSNEGVPRLRISD